MDKKEEILDSAVTVFASEGYHNATVKMIADKADIAVGTVYNYFDNKAEILANIFTIELSKRTDLLKSLKEKELTFQQKAMIFLDKHFSELEANPEVTTVLTQESRPPRKHSLKVVKDFMNQLPALMAELLEEAKEKGEIRDINSQLIANAIFNSLHGMAVKVSQSEVYDFPQAKKELINLYWLGLKR